MVYILSLHNYCNTYLYYHTLYLGYTNFPKF